MQPQNDPANTPLVLALLDNLFFVAKLNEAVKTTGAQLLTARTMMAALDKAQTTRPGLIVVDLDAAACAPLLFIQQIKADLQLKKIPLLGFVAHVNTGIQEQARQAGCNRVLARSIFSRDLPSLVQQALAPIVESNLANTPN
jgi:CheY-like chemotaxis protein